MADPKSYWPENTDDILYFPYETNLQSMLDEVKKIWPEVSLNDICIEARHIHTDCIGHDQYDSSDYTDFVVVTRKIN